MWLTEEQQQIWRGYLTMASGLQIAMHRQLQQDCGLSLADYDVLVALSERRVSHQLRRMRDRGLVQRHGNRDDRRGATAELTDGGRAALRAAAPGHAELVRSVVFDGLTAAQLRAFDSVVKIVLGRLTSPHP